MKTTKSSKSANQTQIVTVNGVATEIKSTEKVVTNMMTQVEIVIDKDTPLCCDPSMETYWSM